MRIAFLPILVLFALGLGACQKVEVDKELYTFCHDPYTSYSCDEHASYLGPDWDDEPIVFLDSATGQPDTVFVTARSLFMMADKARIPRLFPKKKYTDLYVERFYLRATGFRLPGNTFEFQGEAKTQSVTAAWGSYRNTESVERVLAYVEDSILGRPRRDQIQLWVNIDFDATSPRVLSAEFISTLGLYKLRVGPYDGKATTYIRQNLFY